MSEQTIFLTALEYSGPERTAYLDQACSGNVALRRQVDELLAAHERSSEFLDEPAVEQMVAQAPPGEQNTRTYNADANSTPEDRTAVAGDSPRDESLGFLNPPTRTGSIGRLDHYEILERVGMGGFGTVYRAFDDRLHRMVAVKVLAPAYAANGSARRRFIREARTAAAIKNEHIVGIYDVEEDAQPPYLAMELIDGISLQDKIDKTGPLGVKEILRIGLQIAEGLTAAHKQGLVHRDIKPSNILLENGVERVKITDFGLARAVDDASVTQSGTVAGTPMYMSPEQAEGLPIDHRSDLFSLGTVMYTMCTGHSPFRASGTHAVLKRVIEASPRPIREINDEIPEWLCDIIAKLHAKKPAERFQSAKDVAELLQEHLAHLQQPSQAPMPAPVLQPARAKALAATPRRWLSPAMFLLLLPTIVVSVLLIASLIFEQLRPLLFGSIAFAALGLVLTGVMVLIVVIGRLRPVSSAPVAKRRWWQLAIPAALALLVPLVVYLSFGRSIGLYYSNEGEVRVDDFNPEFEEFRVVRDGTSTEVTLGPDTHENRSQATVWKIKPRETLKLPPGNYRVQAVARNGETVTRWRLDVSAMFSGLAHTRDEKDIKIEVKRGERISLSVAKWEMKSPTDEDSPGGPWVQLFNSTDLTGWKTHPDYPGDWRVEDGILIGRGPLTSYLFTEREDFENFHLRAEVKINAKSDSGLLFRSGFEILYKKFPAAYEANITNGIPFRAAPLNMTIASSETGVPLASLEENPSPADTWIVEEVIAQDNRIIIKVGGKTVADWTDPKFTYARGRLALQVYGNLAPATTAYFRKIEIRELPAKEPTDLEKLQGSWVAVTGEINNRPLDAHTVERNQFVFTGNRVITDGYSKGVTFKLDESKSPKWIDVTDPSGKKVLGIYRFEGERLSLCMDEEPAPRPERFESSPKSWRVNVVLRRLSPTSEPGWVSLFNGIDLTGLKTDGSWKVDTGVLINETPNSRVFPTTLYGDFDCRMELNLSADAIGSFDFRAQAGLGGGVVLGKMSGDKGNLSQTGSIFQTVKLNAPLALWSSPQQFVRPDRWYVAEVSVRGNEVVARIDGIEMARATLVNPPASGGIALHATAGKIRVRKIEIKELPANSPPVPKTAAEVLPFLAGSWKVTTPPTDAKLPPDSARDTSFTTFDFVGGGKFLRQRGMRHTIFAYDAEKGILRQWAAASTAPNGPTWGPATGLFNPTNRTVTWTVRSDGGNEVIHQSEAIDANTMNIRVFQRDAKDNIVQNLPVRLTRVNGPVTLPNWPIDAKRPEEMKVLDQLVGEWSNEPTVKDIATPGKPKAEPARVKTESILGGRFVETIQTYGPDNRSNYSLSWYDTSAKQYRQWMFSAGGQAHEFAGIWNESAKSLTWNYPTPRAGLAFRTIFKSDDLHELQNIVTDKDGKVVIETYGVSRRIASDGFVPLFNGKDLTGWKYHPTQQGDWKVDGNVLVGSGRKSHLFTERGDFTDFRLRFEAKINTGDSAVFLRTPFYLKSQPVAPGIIAEVPYGYEAQINEKTGTLIVDDPIKNVYGQRAGIPPDTWFTGEVFVTGNRVRVLINGKETADYTDPKPTYPKGHLALQCLGGGTVVQFRRIEIRELQPSASGKDVGSKTATAEQQKLQGKWKAVFVAAPNAGPLEEVPKEMSITFNFAGDRATLEFIGAEPLGKKTVFEKKIEGAYHMDPAAKPARINIMTVGDSKSAFVGIYRLDGELLQLCGATNPTKLEYPTEFKTAPGSPFQHWVFKRIPDTKESGPAPKPADPRPDADKLQGAWKVIGCEMDGEKLTGMKFFPSQMNVRVTFSGNQFHYKWNLPSHLAKYKDELKPEFDGVFKLDEKANPKRISMTVPSDPKNNMLGIYKLDGDRLTIRWRSNPTDAKYPTGFETKPGDDTPVLIFERVVQLQPDPADVERAKLLGRWTPVSAEFDGKPLAPKEVRRQWGEGAEINFTRYRCEYTFPDRARKAQVSYFTDPTKSPKEIEIQNTLAGDMAPHKGIYEVEGDTLKLCIAERGKPRPTAINTDDKGDRVLVTYRRVVAPKFIVKARDGKPERTFATVDELIEASNEGDQFEIRGLPNDPNDPQVKKLRQELIETHRVHLNARAGRVAATLMAQIAWPADQLDRKKIPDKNLTALGFKDLAQCPAEVVAIIREPGPTGGRIDWGTVPFAVVSPDGRTLAYSAGMDVVLWDIGKGEPRHRLKGHTWWVTGIAYSPDGKTIATSSCDETIKLWDAESGVEGPVLTGHKTPVRCVAFSPDGKWLASGGGTASPAPIYLWDLEKRSPFLQLKDEDDGMVRAVAFSPDGKSLASTGTFKTVKLWELKSGQRQHSFPAERPSFDEFRYIIHHPAVAWRPDGKTVASPAKLRTLRLWDVAKGKEERTLSDTDQQPAGVCYSPDGSVLASVGRDHLTLRDGQTYASPRTIAINGLWVACAPDSRHLVVARKEGMGEGTRALGDLTYVVLRLKALPETPAPK